MLPVGLKNALTIASGILGERRDPYLGHNFLVEIDGLVVAGFSQVEGLGSTIETEDYVEGGVNDFTHKLLKNASHPNLILRRGLTEADTLWCWYDDTRQGRIQRRSGTIMLLDDQRLPVTWWSFREAIPVRWSGPTFDAGREGGEVAVESLELVHLGISRPLVSELAASLRVAAGIGT